MNIDNEINLIDIFKEFFKLRLVIFLLTIVFTFLGFLYSMQLSSSFKSNTMIEIGYFRDNQGAIKPIESTSELLKNIKIDLIYKRPDLNLSDVKFNSIEDKLIDISIISLSSKSNQIALNYVNNYVLERHSNLLESRKLRLETEIKSLNDEINRINDEIISIKNAIIFEIKGKIKKLKNQLLTTEKKIKVLNQIISEDSQNLEFINANIEARIERVSKNPTLNQIISEYKTKIINNEEKISLINFEIENLEFVLKSLNDANSDSSNSYAFNQLNERESERLNIFNLNARRIKLLEDKILLDGSLKISTNNKIYESKIIKEISSTTIQPNRTLYIVFGFLFGLILSFALVLVSSYTRATKGN